MHRHIVNGRPRRGVLLLIILGLLAMFALIGFSFVLVSNQQWKSSEAARRAELRVDPGRQLLDDAFAQLVRGTNNKNSVVAARSLLEEKYGNRARVGLIQNNITLSTDLTKIAGGALIQFKVQSPVKTDWPQYPVRGLLPHDNDNTRPPEDRDPELTAADTDPIKLLCAQRVGCVLTFLNGPVAGVSTRILQYIPPSGPATSSNAGFFQVMATEQCTYDKLYNYFNGGTPSNHLAYVINGVEFSGRGFGVGAEKDNASLKKRLMEFALLPNHPQNRPPLGPIGGANTDYTAPDYQHMSLALMLPVDTLNRPTSGTGPGITVPIPSFHRTELLAYWAKYYGINTAGTPIPDLDPTAFTKSSGGLFSAHPDVCFRAMMRPIGALPAIDINFQGLHPKFTGSNPRFNPMWDGRFTPDSSDPTRCKWAWDVDNDGDGVPDSVWVDLGMPVRTTIDGRRYKPLFAVLVTDLDGRLNVNAHGNLKHMDATFGKTPPKPFATYPTTADQQFEFAGLVTELNLGGGTGYGPAEIGLSSTSASLPSIFSSTAMRNVMQGNGVLEGRYGSPSSSAIPGRTGFYEPLRKNRFYEHGLAYYDFLTGSSVTQYDAYGTPANLFGLGAVGVDTGGRPVYAMMGETPATGITELYNTPYELNLAGGAWRKYLNSNNTIDNPFTTAELEAVLRRYDVDGGSLPQRLIDLTATSSTVPEAVARRNELTTEQWDSPAPPVVPSYDRFVIATLPSPTNHFTDLLRVRGVPIAEWPKLVPPEMLAGLRLDLNRPFGNGREGIPTSGSTTPVVDNPELGLAPASSGFTYPSSWLVGPDDAALGTPMFDLNNGQEKTTGTPYLTKAVHARELYARYLYVLACLMLDPSDKLALESKADKVYWDFSGGTGTGTPAQKRAARLLAQWAVNVVDFRDRDSIMTRFVYDADFYVSPATGWTADWSDTSTETVNVVYGCEKPELLITETFGMHDHRTEDRDDEAVSGGGPPSKCLPPGPNADADFDQRVPPQGSLFVELYNPGSELDAPNKELNHVVTGSTTPTAGTVAGAKWGVKLDMRSGGTTGSPVWRMAIVAGTTGTSDPDLPGVTATIERSVYFVDPTGLSATDDGTRYHSSRTAIPAVRPGHYAVIGPGETASSSTTDPGRTYIGRNESQTDPDSDTRYIELNPHNGVNDTAQPGTPSYPVRVKHNGSSSTSGNDLEQGSTKPIKHPVAVIIDTPRRISVSEPTAGYPAPAAGGQYSPIFDEPLDTTNPEHVNFIGTKPRFKIVHLQRLANPTKAYDSVRNPYLTVDSMPVDLTVFNGYEYQNPNPDPSVTSLAVTKAFRSRQRGEAADVDSVQNNVWVQEPLNDGNTADSPDQLTAGGASPPVFKRRLMHSLGYLNTTYGVVRDIATAPMYSKSQGDPATYPFPWLAWNNRPFANPLEILQVPFVSSSKLLKRGFFSLYRSGSPYNWTNGTPEVAPPAVPDPPTSPFAHLFDFFDSQQLTVSGSNSVQMHRLLEYVTVPSRFVGTEIQASYTGTATPADYKHRFHPPFNWIPTYREPGKVNLNTISGERVWNGLMNQWQFTGTADWIEFLKSRRGVTSVPGTTNAIQALLEVRPDYPSRFENPFRSYAGSYLVPPVKEATGGGLQALEKNIDRQVNATVLRSRPDPTGSLHRPLFAIENAAAGGNPANSPLPQNAERHAFYRYGNMQRLSSMTTNRSNVFAAWITVGFFEVEPISGYSSLSAQQKEFYPDGYRLGQELGMDTGEVRRHRAFYIFDRSLPVGFVRGHDVNFDKGVLMRRFIE